MRILTAVLLAILFTFGLCACSAPAEEPQTALPETTAAVTETPETSFPEETIPIQTEPPKVTIDTVPLYLQTDYPHDIFSYGTIRTSGCSITCLAMVATYLTDCEYLPNQMAYHFGNHGKDNVERLIYGNEQMQLPNVRTDNVQDVFRALREGKVVIAMMDADSHFTSTQHFIVLAGMTPEGKIIVNDPLRKIHTSEDAYLHLGYENGFSDHDIASGFSGAWIYDKAAMPEDPFLYDAVMPVQQESRYEGYFMSEADREELACFLWAECREESAEVQQAIAEVLLNRLFAEGFPYTVHKVIYNGEYYDRTKKMAHAQPGEEQYQIVDAAMFGPYVLAKDVLYFSRWEKHGEVWGTLGPYTFLHSK